MVSHGAPDAVHREDVVVGHGVLVAVVIVLDGGGDVVGGVDVDSSIEDMRRGVGCEDFFYEGLKVCGGHFGGGLLYACGLGMAKVE